MTQISPSETDLLLRGTKMGIWTSVTAVLRIGCENTDDLEDDPPDIGTKASWEYFSEEEWEEVLRLPDDEFLHRCNESPSTRPRGREGSLEASLWINPIKNAANKYVVTVWGDISYISPEGIISWIQAIPKNKPLLRGVISLDCDDITSNLVYNTEKEQWEKLG